MKERNNKIAHLRLKEDDLWDLQSVEEHSKGVAELAYRFASPFGMKFWGKALGMLHDIGKNTDDFQRYIRVKSGYDQVAGRWRDKDHAWIGAKAIYDIYNDLLIMPNIIAGHHRGLYDIFELQKVVDRELPEGIAGKNEKYELDVPPFVCNGMKCNHLVRMLFSCLVDADYLDTERFMHPQTYSERGDYDSIETLKEMLDTHIRKLSKGPETDVNRIRNEVQTLCIKSGKDSDTGFYQLTVPTGGGKTLASMVWALHHAAARGKKRVIVAIPYTSIITQTAQTLRDIFGERNVLEHHSVIDEAKITGANRLAMENWDAPIIVTTNVQLFESMYSNRPGKCRKLHSLCDSVVVLDEVQALPMSMLQPVTDAMDAYCTMFKTSFILCTASQPILDGNHKGLGIEEFKGLKGQVDSIIPDELELHERLRRVRIEFEEEPIDIETIAGKVARQDRALCVVNTRNIAAQIYDALPEGAKKGSYHLSRMMCPAHTLKSIDEIKKRLAETDKPVRVISTQLIEAGVDIDFPTVFRQEAGLDSLLQAAGRCNREGRLKEGTTYVFSISDYHPRGAVKNAIYALKRILKSGAKTDWFAPQTMRQYFTYLFSVTDKFDIKGIRELLENPNNARYQEASERFRMIDDAGRPVIVNYDSDAEHAGEAGHISEPERLVDILRSAGPSRSLMRKLGQYTVNINSRLFESFLKDGVVKQVWEGIYYIPLREQYDPTTGLKASNEYLEQFNYI